MLSASRLWIDSQVINILGYVVDNNGLHTSTGLKRKIYRYAVL